MIKHAVIDGWNKQKFKIGYEEIEKVKNLKYLGVVIKNKGILEDEIGEP